MSGKLDHYPGEILKQLLVDLGAGTLVSGSGDWPIYYSIEPETPDNCITVYDTEGVVQGRIQALGTMTEKYGIQIKIRAQTVPLGRAKGNALVSLLDRSIRQAEVSLDASSYLVEGFHRTGNLIHLGREPSSGRRLWSINGMASIRMTTGTAF